ncbi:MAG: ribosome-associated translation inhibitor RaiA [Candidatus Saccharibacteria bacterium]|nr:ribosome-associated translation inhibitor RaiA [Candidatus Saccharibacteria bacterium]
MNDQTLNVEISGTNYKLNEHKQAYIEKKCRKLVNHMSNRSKDSAFVSVKITKIDPKAGNEFQCDATLTLPDKKLVAGEAAPDLMTAIDIVENKLQGQIRKYKTERRNDGVNRGGIVARLKRSLRRK